MPAGKRRKRLAAFAALLAAGAALSAAQPAGAATQAPARPPVVTQTIPVGLGPAGVAVSPRTGKIYLTNAGTGTYDGTVLVINGRNGAVTSTIGVGTFPDAVAVSPRTGQVYAAGRGERHGQHPGAHAADRMRADLPWSM